jgi:hypothetical protein
LPEDLRKEVKDFALFLLEEEKKPTFSWPGALSEFKDQYTSVELQHKISQVEDRRRMRVLLDTKAEKFDLTIVSFDSNFDKTDLVRKTQFDNIKNNRLTIILKNLKIEI